MQRIQTLVTGTAMAAVLLAAPAAFADVIIDFEASGFTPGESVNNHMPDGTEASPAISGSHLDQQAFYVRTTTTDEEIVDLGGSDPTHGKVWRFSNGADSGTQGGATQTPHLDGVAGEPGAYNDAGRGAPTTNTFYGKLDFRSVTDTAQDGLLINIVGAAYDTRQTYVRILDDGGAGLDLLVYETLGDNFVSHTLDLDLSRDEWHTLEMETTFNDGFASGSYGDTDIVGNDLFNVYLDGTSVFSGTDWESYFGSISETRSMDSLAFNGTTDQNVLGGGLYFDNILLSSSLPNRAAVPEPATLALLGVGLAGVGFARRRKRS